LVTSYRLLKISTERLPWLCRITRKSGSCDALQLEAARRRFNYEAHNEPGYKFNNSRRKYFVNQWAYNLCFGKIHIARTHKRLFRSELPYKILTSLLDSATLIFWEKIIFWQSNDVFGYFMAIQIEICHIFYFRFIWQMTVNMFHLLRSAL